MSDSNPRRPRTSLGSFDDDPLLGGFSGSPTEPNAEPVPEEPEDSIFFVAPEPAPPMEEPRPLEAPSFDAAEPEAPLAPEPTPEPAPTPAPDPTRDPRLLSDPVLKALVDAGICTPAHLIALWPLADRQPPGTPPWRAALELPGVASEAALAIAARVAGHPEAAFHRRPAGRAIMAGTIESLAQPFRDRCRALGVLPFGYEGGGPDGHLSLELAATDTQAPDVQGFIHELRMPVRLHYAPAEAIRPHLELLGAR